jgi:osmoprotectant transport system substrate-binding protein
MPLFALGLTLVLVACTGGPAAAPGATQGRQAITIASFDFAESEILAQLYAQALHAKGYPVRVLPNAGTRELLQPALAAGLIDLLPEYAGSALSFLTLGTDRPGPSVDRTHQALTHVLATNGVEALTPAPAQDANAIVVTKATADLYGLSTVSDLTAVASQLVFGGPHECPIRPFCLLGLQSVYHLSFKQFAPLDTGGPLTLQALRSGEIQVALLFTTDPAIVAEHLVVLVDDKELQPAENVIPVVRQAILSRYGASFAEAVDAVSARLTTSELQTLIGRVSLDGQAARLVAAGWLEDQGLA